MHDRVCIGSISFPGEGLEAMVEHWRELQPRRVSLVSYLLFEAGLPAVRAAIGGRYRLENITHPVLGMRPLSQKELWPQAQPLVAEGALSHAIVAAYTDYLQEPTDLKVPDAFKLPRQAVAAPNVTLWSDALAAGLVPGPHTAGPDDLACMRGQRPGQDHGHRADGEQQDEHEGHAHAQRHRLPDRAPFLDVVDRVGGLHERRHVAGR